MKAITTYTLNLEQQKQIVKMPEGAEILSAGTKEDDGIIYPCINVLQSDNPNVDTDKREIRIYKLLEKVDEFDLVLIGKVEINNEVLHIFENL